MLEQFQSFRVSEKGLVLAIFCLDLAKMFLRIVVQCIQSVDCFLLTAEGPSILLEAFEARSTQMACGRGSRLRSW